MRSWKSTMKRIGARSRSGTLAGWVAKGKGAGNSCSVIKDAIANISETAAHDTFQAVIPCDRKSKSIIHRALKFLLASCIAPPFAKVRHRPGGLCRLRLKPGVPV